MKNKETQQMSDDLIKQVKDLSDANAKLSNENKTLTAQVQAFNQSFSEALQTSVNLRTNNILFQQMVQDGNQKVAELNKQISDLKAAHKAEIDKLLAPAPIPATQPEGEVEPAAA